MASWGELGRHKPAIGSFCGLAQLEESHGLGKSLGLNGIQKVGVQAAGKQKKGGGTLHEVSRLAGLRHLSGAADGATVTRVWGCRIQV